MTQQNSSPLFMMLFMIDLGKCDPICMFNLAALCRSRSGRRTVGEKRGQGSLKEKRKREKALGEVGALGEWEHSRKSNLW